MILEGIEKAHLRLIRDLVKLQEEVRLAKIAFYATKQLILKLQGEIEQLKAVRDALGRSNKNALADRNTFIKKVEVLEGENAKLREELVRQNAKLAKMALRFDKAECVIADLRERLETIKQHWEQMPKENQSIYWTSICDDEIQDEFIGQKFFTDLQKWYQELGVLLSPKELDQKTREGDIK